MATATSPDMLAGKAVSFRPRSFWLDVLVRLVRTKPLGLVGGIIIIVMLFAAIAAPIIEPYDYKEIVGSERLKPPSTTYFLGTDNFGRDMFSRIVQGARISLRVGFSTVVISTIAAALLGITSAYFGGWADTITQRFVDVMQAFPGLILILTIMAVLGTGINNVVLAIAIFQTVGGSRVIRGAALSVKEMPFIEAE